MRREKKKVVMLLLLLIQVYFVMIYGADKCTVPYIKNGVARPKGIGRHIRFNCRREYQLMGAKYAHCIRRSWDTEFPVCIKPGCKWNRTENMNGVFIDSYKGALIKVDCNPGYIAHYGNTVYCDGFRWNGTFPSCQRMYNEPPKTCDFGTGLCGWIPDPSNKGIKWVKGKNSIPENDHTFRQPLINGNISDYMFVKNVLGRSFVVNDDESIKLYSPVYPPSYATGDTCFTFWYSSAGPSPGNLRVFVLMEGWTLDTTIPSFWQIGEPGWKKGTFYLPPVTENFQILIEVTKFDGYDIAIDDVTLGDFGCEMPTTSTTEELTTDEFDTADDFSCRGRCGMEPVLISSNITADDLEEPSKCNCYANCLKSKVCCHDFIIYCRSLITGPRDRPEATESTESSKKYTTINKPTSISDWFSTKLAVNLNNTTAYPVYNTTTSTTIKITEKTTIATVGKTNFNKNAVQSNQSVNSHKTSSSLNPTQRTTTTMSNNVPIIARNTTQDHSKLKISEEHNFVNAKLSDQTKARKEAASSSEGMQNESAVMGVEISDIIQVSVGSLVAILLIVSIIYIVVRRRRRLAEQFEGAEDSEVSLITSDEYLDFTLQKLAESVL